MFGSYSSPTALTPKPAEIGHISEHLGSPKNMLQLPSSLPFCWSTTKRAGGRPPFLETSVRNDPKQQASASLSLWPGRTLRREAKVQAVPRVVLDDQQAAFGPSDLHLRQLSLGFHLISQIPSPPPKKKKDSMKTGDVFTIRGRVLPAKRTLLNNG